MSILIQDSISKFIISKNIDIEEFYLYYYSKYEFDFISKNNNIDSLEMFQLISIEANKILESRILSSISDKQLEDINSFISSNYYTMFKTFYDRNNHISEEDYDEVIVSICYNWTCTKEIADIILGNWLEQNIINLI